MKKTLFILFSTYVFFSTGQKVGNIAFDNTLKLLLNNSVSQLSVPEAAKLEGIVFIDARKYEEYSVSHIKEALWVGFDDFNINRLHDIPYDKTLIIYCSVGYRSEKIGEQLLAAGYNKVYNLYGGIFEWVNQGYPVYSDSTQTAKVHAYDKAWGIWLQKGEKMY